MINEIRNVRVYSSLNLLCGNNLAKTNCDNLSKFVEYLKYENFDGWMSSIENGTAVEVALINDPALFTIKSVEPLEFNWKNANYNNSGELVPKNWGSKYTISSKTYPILLDVHIRFKTRIEKYVETIARNEPFGTALSIILDNAYIKYHDGNIHNIKWTY